MDTIAKIRAAHQNPAATVDELAAAAAGARQLAEAADRDVATFTSERPGLLLRASDKEIARHDEAVALGKRTAEVARALAEACDGRAAELRKAAAELRRRERYAAAQALAAALPASIAPDYAELVRLGRSIVERIGLAAQARAEANADLPEGALPLPDVESFRQVPSIPKRVTAARLVHLYVAENGQPFHDQDRVRPDPGGSGMGWRGGWRTHDDLGRELPRHTVRELYRCWPFVEYQWEGETRYRNPGVFAAELAIPPLYGQQPAGWTPTDNQDRGLSALAHADDAVAEPPQPYPEPKRTVRLERFEQEWGPFDALACNVQAEAPSGLKRMLQAVTGRP